MAFVFPSVVYLTNNYVRCQSLPSSPHASKIDRFLCALSCIYSTLGLPSQPYNFLRRTVALFPMRLVIIFVSTTLPICATLHHFFVPRVTSYFKAFPTTRLCCLCCPLSVPYLRFRTGKKSKTSSDRDKQPSTLRSSAHVF